MVTRLRFPKGKQRAFIDAVLARSGLSLDQLANRCAINARTLRDWRREKHLASREAFKNLSEEFHISIESAETLSPFWYASKGASLGAKKRMELHGSLGTPAGRSKGGKMSQERRKSDPEKYRALGCNVAKDFIAPSHSVELAELVGIFLGDGGLQKYQAKIFLSALVDREYSYFVSDLIKKVFGVEPSRFETKSDNCIVLVLSGIHFVDILETLGLIRGDKMKNRIRIPDWILKNEKYSIACLRGLFDTDGGFYFHKKKSGVYMGWCFCSYSSHLLEDVNRILRRLGLHATKEQGTKLYLYNLESIERYMELVGSHNAKNTMKLESHMLNRRQKGNIGGVA